MSEAIVLQRDCIAIQVPYGTKLQLYQGDKVTMMHQLGDTFTVQTPTGFILRIDGHDADALGLAVPEAYVVPGGSQVKDRDPTTTMSSNIAVEVSEETLWEVLRSCYDPEIPSNIVELGLIYHCSARPLDDGGHEVFVEMTLTAPGCGMGQVLKDDVERKMLALPQVKAVEVKLVFDPPWEASMMSEAARLQLGMF